MKATKWTSSCAAAVVAAALLSSCSSDSSAGSPDEIVIADIQAATGVSGDLGTLAAQGAEVAVEVLNEQGGVLGKKLKLLLVDDASQVAQSVSLMQKYGADDSIPGMIGPTYSSTFVADAPFAEKYKVSFISSGSTVPWDGDFNDYTFRSSAPGTAYNETLAKSVVENTGAKTVAQIWPTDNPAVAKQGENLKEIFPKLGVDVVTNQAAVNATTDFSSQISAIMDADPDLVTIGLTQSATEIFTQQLRSAGFDGDLMAIGSQLQDPAIYENSHGAAEGLIIPTSFDSTSSAPEVKTFIDAYKAKYGQVPNGQAAFGYDALGLIVDAIKRADSTDREKVRDELGSTDGYQGVQGPFTFDGSGDNTTPAVYILQLTSDGFVKYPTGS